MLVNIGLRRCLKRRSGIPQDYTLYLPFTSSVGSGTFSRTTNAWNPETLAVAPHNMLTYSQDFSNAAWVKTGAAVTANSTIAPDGTLSAYTWTVVNSSGHQLYQIISTANPNVFSCFVKMISGYPCVYITNPTSKGTVYFDLTTGTKVHAGDGAVGNIEFVGNGWYRVSIYTTLTTTDERQVGFLDTVPISYVSAAWTVSTAIGTAGYIWGAQLNQYSLTDYVATTTTAVYSPRYVTGKSGNGLFLERSASNLLTYSQDFRNTTDAGAVRPWAYSGNTITPDSIIAPDGTTTADTLVENSSNSPHYLTYPLTLSAVSYTLSVYAKAKSRNFIALANNSVANADAWFNLASGTRGTRLSGVTSFDITDVGNGWYRCYITFTAIAGSNQLAVFVTNADNNVSYQGDGTSGIYLWGAQVEQNPYATSYLPTGASTTSRSAETLTYATSGIISQPGTVAGWWKPEGEATGTVQTIWSSYTDASNYTALKYNGVIAYIEKAKTGQTTEYVTYAVTLPTTSFTHFAIQINADGTMGLYVNGASAQSGLGADLVDTLNTASAWDKYGTNTVVDDSGAVKITYVDHSYGGYTYLRATYGLTTDLTVNKIYLMTGNARVSAGNSVDIYGPIGITSGTVSTVTSTTIVAWSESLIAQTATTQSIGMRNMGTGEAIWLSGMVFKEIYNSTSSTFAPVIASTMQVGSINGATQGDGTFDEFYFYNRVLTTAEIALLAGI